MAKPKLDDGEDIPWKGLLGFFIYSQGLESWTVNIAAFNKWMTSQRGAGLRVNSDETTATISFLTHADIALLATPTPGRKM